ncbi:MAG: acyl-CoA dehydrogenase family protein [Paracoccaceae bacterium]|nr:acyl-CoA dehydrogenase family protein [Paracoccaceae bacterium]
MDFSLSPEQNLIFDTAFEFGQKTIEPHALEWEDSFIPRDILKEAGELGFAALYVDEKDGGSGLSRLDSILVFEALAMACPSVSSFISIHNMCAWMISRYGNSHVKDEFLAPMIKMDKICSYCLTEPNSGSDSAALQTSAEKTNDGFKLNGSKAFISGGNFSDFYLSMVRTGGIGPKGISAVLVKQGTKGLSFGKPEQKMGWKSQPTAEVIFADCSIPARNLLGKEDEGFTYAMQGLDGGRLNIAAAALGGAQTSLNKAKQYMKERPAFGKKLRDFQGLQFKIADMEIAINASRTFLREAAWKLDNGSTDASIYCAMAKKFVTDHAFTVANDALQLLGGYGYLADYGMEKIVRDLRVHQILEGTNEIMQVIIARHFLR